MMLAACPSLRHRRRLWSSGSLVGLINGALVAYMNLSAFVATLATLTSVTASRSS